VPQVFPLPPRHLVWWPASDLDGLRGGLAGVPSLLHLNYRSRHER